MATKPQNRIVGSGKNKSLYTAVLYDSVPESNTSSFAGEAGAYSSYLRRITREHLSRASMEEVDSSVVGSPSPESKRRVAQLTQRVKRAYSEANGNPANGRWSFISDLLRLSTTRGGRRWLDVNTTAEVPEIPDHLCIIPKTSEEWHELERKWKEEEEVKSKVQRWITTAEFEPLTPEATVVREPAEGEELPPIEFNEKDSGDSTRKLTTQATLKGISTLNDPLFGGSKLGFSVVKRSNTIASGKPVPPKSQQPFSPSHANYSVPKSSHREGDIKPGRDLSLSEEQNQIPAADHGDISTNVRPLNLVFASSDTFHDQDFLPPSFSLSQVQTSTPRAGRVNDAQRSSPIPFAGPLSLPSPVATPKPTKTYARPRTTFPVSPALPDPERPSPQPQGGVTGVTRKRSLSPSLQGGPATKRARWVTDEVTSQPSTRPLPQIPSSPQDINVALLEVTPQRNLPRLKELLASAKRSRHETPRVKRPSEVHADLPVSIKDSGHGSGLNPSNTVTVKEQAVATVILNSELAFHDPTPNSTHELPPSPEAVETGAEVAVSSNETESVPYSPKSPPDLPVSGDPNGFDFDEPSTHDSPSHNHCPQTISEAESQPELTIEKVLAQDEPRPLSPIPPESPGSNPFLANLADVDSLPDTHGAVIYELYGLDGLDNPSPTKSLSSLADADSESDSDLEVELMGMDSSKSLHLLDSEFRPQLTSTQKSHTGLDADLSVAAFGASLPPDGLVWGDGDRLVSTSQLQAEVNSQVDELDKFMEADLGYGFVPEL